MPVAEYRTSGTPIPSTARAFPAQGSALHTLLTSAEFKRSFHARLRTFNPLITFLYRLGVLPLLGAGKRIMLLTTRGRKTGRLRQFPIGYFRIDRVIHVFSGWGREDTDRSIAA